MRRGLTIFYPHWLLTFLLIGAGHSIAGTCSPSETSDQPTQLLWGDLHVHTAYSLDAYAFGALATPEDAYRFARGKPLTLDTGDVTTIDRPLDFAAVTDHAATFDLMYACTDPMYSDDAYCRSMRDLRANRDPRNIFNNYLLPIVSLTPPSRPEICDDVDCDQARASQWQRMQDAANEANVPCDFTALIGYEWTASPGGQHWHRNVIYRTDRVPDQVFDYVRFPQVSQLWQQLDTHCRTEDGCEALAIPHNINWADGATFDTASESPTIRALRAKYERLAEVHQEKGNSECLPADPEDGPVRNDSDCGFERVTFNAAKLRMSGPSEDPVAAWKTARKSYYRSLLNEGLVASTSEENPLMLGAIGSTDNHFGTPGHVAEASFFGGIAMLWQPPTVQMGYLDFNPGGLVAVWAATNTREDIFDALKRREAYATSGPRIALKFGTTIATACSVEDPVFTTRMGGRLTTETPTFTVIAGKDTTDLAAVDIVTATVVDGEIRERVIRIADHAEGKDSICVSWADTTFKPDTPAYWYARVVEVPTPRWSKLLCERHAKCAEHPDADQMIQERAWSSPIWYQPPIL